MIKSAISAKRIVTDVSNPKLEIDFTDAKRRTAKPTISIKDEATTGFPACMRVL